MVVTEAVSNAQGSVAPITLHFDTSALSGASRRVFAHIALQAPPLPLHHIRVNEVVHKAFYDSIWLRGLAGILSFGGVPAAILKKLEAHIIYKFPQFWPLVRAQFMLNCPEIVGIDHSYVHHVEKELAVPHGRLSQTVKATNLAVRLDHQAYIFAVVCHLI